jgi:hypothetical protein
MKTVLRIKSWASWSDNPMIRGFIVKFLVESTKILSMAVLDPLKILVGMLTTILNCMILTGNLTAVSYYSYGDSQYLYPHKG